MLNIKYFLLTVAVTFSMKITASAQYRDHHALRDSLTRLSLNDSGKLGVGLKLIETGDTLTFNNEQRYPMQSVFKFPIAISVLRSVQQGRLSLGQKIHIREQDLHKTVSALYDKYPGGNVDIPLHEILSDMVTLSDNNACDILLGILGGPQKVSREMHGLGITDMKISVNEDQMHQDWNAQYLNWSKPSALVGMLEKLYLNKLLSDKNTKMLIKLMEHTFVAPKRIRGRLPAGTIVAHRSGTSSTDKAGLSPATNDVGVITLPNGKHLAIAILLADCYLPAEQRDDLIARVSKICYDHYSQ